MCEPEDIKLIPKAESGTFCLDLDNSQINVHNEVKDSDYSLLKLAEDSAVNKSLLVKTTNKIPDEGATKNLQKSLCESNLLDYTVYGTGRGDKTNNSTSIQIVNEKDIAISANTKDISVFVQNVADSTKSKNNDAPFTEEEFPKDEASSIIMDLVDREVVANQPEVRADDGAEKIVLTSTEALKESVGRCGSNNKLVKNEECKLLESGELPQDTTVDVKEVQALKSKSKDLEDGEVSGDDGEAPVKGDNIEMPVCRFFIRNGCNWGMHCRFRHPTNKGNYVMFEQKVLPVVSTPYPVAPWPPVMTPAYPLYFNNMDSGRYYSQDKMDVPIRGSLLPTPSFNETTVNYPKSAELDRPFPNQDKTLKPRLISWQSHVGSSPPCSTTFARSPPRPRSPSVSPPRHTIRIRPEIRSTDTSTVTCRHTKRYRLPSPSRSSVSRIRGPRTPSQSPPKRKIRVAPKRPRHKKYESSSSDSSESSSYESSSDSSEGSSSSSKPYGRHRRKSSRRISSSKAQAKSTSRTSTKSTSMQLDWSTSLRKESSSKSQKHSARTHKKLSTRTPERTSLKVPSRTSMKSRGEAKGPNPYRKKYLLMKLMEVEDQIAKRKKNMKLK